MKKWTILLLIFLISLNLVYGSICEDTLTIGKNCTMLTPVISCSTYNYSIFNETNLVSKGNLTLISDSIYKFTFNQSAGDYIVKLCDSSTREIRVLNEMIAESIIYSVLLILLVIFFLSSLVLAYALDGNNKFTMGNKGSPILELNLNKYLKLFLYLLSYLFFWMLTWTAWQVSDIFLLSSGLTNILKIIFIIESIAWLPLLIVIISISLIKYLADADLENTISRGLNPR